MPATPPNIFLRLIVPIIVAAAVLYVGYSVFKNTANQPGSATPAAPAPTPADQAAPVLPADAPSEPNSTPDSAPAPAPAPAPAGDDVDPGARDPAASPSSSAQPQAGAADGSPLTPAAASFTGLRAKALPPSDAPPTPLGDVGPDTTALTKLTFTWSGAGVDSITSARYYDAVKDKLARDASKHYEIQRKGLIATTTGRNVSVSSLAARAAFINGQFVDLYGTASERVWEEVGPGVFRAEIIDQAGAPVARITRTYVQRPGSYDFTVAQSFENLTTAPLSLQWIQYGPIDLREEFTGYSIDVRRLRFGYLLEPARDPSQSFVQADSQLKARATVLDKIEKQLRVGGRADLPVWPSTEFAGSGRLTWIAQTSRYFAFSIHPLIDPADPKAVKAFKLGREAHAVMIGRYDSSHASAPGGARLAIELHSDLFEVAPGAGQDLSFGVFAGPLARSELASGRDPLFSALALDRLVIFNLGGMCAWCTFQWLARLLFDYLYLLHDYLVFDWAIAIMLLVVTVRAILHPITRRSQISLTRFGKQMQALAPKQKKIQEMYKDDPVKMRQELTRLMKEENVNYAGALGCLPMFLQSPVWFALYAMLYFAFELRHEAAYYGLFQALSGGAWTFLADLSSPDRFITFGGWHVTIPLMGDIASLNVLPFLLGIVFFIQQKYLSPPATGSLTTEQEMQQKMMKWMMVIMFPVMMYNAPSGLAIYFITNSTLGILESRWIRAHIDELDKNPPPAKPAGPLGRKKVPNTAADPRRDNEPRQRFKSRD